jgi:rubredoxin
MLVDDGDLEYDCACPRCRSRPTVQSAVELRPGVEYLTLRCTFCGHVYDAQVPSDPTKSTTLAKAKPPLG